MALIGFRIDTPLKLVNLTSLKMNNALGGILPESNFVGGLWEAIFLGADFRGGGAGATFRGAFSR